MELVPALRRSASWLLDAILPPRCLKCGEIVGDPGALCGPCWSALKFLTAPCCACCGLPFEFEMGEGSLCGACTAERPLYDRARSALTYDDASRDLILRFKHADRIDGAATFASWMARAGAELVSAADIIAPVPLHRWRLVRRRYNQAAILANTIGRARGKLVIPDLLVRRKATESQGHLGRSQRRRNVAGAFALHPQRAQVATGARILLIDDVLTTGATAEACARALRNAGASAVDLLVLARVVRVQQN
ncbi:MAG TPA: ComF family protein [Dongiaceae bacterium]|jgi:ComF family protein|nr:ComF family protein [Dongiaceae bacterium]